VKRTITEFQLPYLAGMSRHGAGAQNPKDAVDRSPLE